MGACEVSAGYVPHWGGALWLELPLQKLKYFTGVSTFKQKIQLILAVQLLTQCWQQESEQADLVLFPKD